MSTTTPIPALLRGDTAAAILARELIAMFEQLGFQRPDMQWPAIELVDEPPARLDGEIDGLLGQYANGPQTVTLFLNPLAAAAQQRQSNIAATIAVVLAHELTHWVTDRFVHPQSGLNSTAFSQYGQDGLEGDAVTEVVEGIAELATFAAINRVADANLTNTMLTCFKAGHQHLNDKYRAFDLYFEFWPLDRVIGHLIRLARRNDPKATPLKGQKDGLDFEFHWLGVEASTEGTHPWMLHREDGPAVAIPPNVPGQIAHDPSGWYRWPSKAISAYDAEMQPNWGLPQRPNGQLQDLWVTGGQLNPFPFEPGPMRYSDESKFGLYAGGQHSFADSLSFAMGEDDYRTIRAF
jgi:hypothetical protein